MIKYFSNDYNTNTSINDSDCDDEYLTQMNQPISIMRIHALACSRIKGVNHGNNDDDNQVTTMLKEEQSIKFVLSKFE